MYCIRAKDIKFSPSGEKSLKLLKEKIKLSKYLSIVLTSSIVYDFIFETKPILKAYKIGTTDFKTFADALKASNDIPQAIIRRDIKMAYISSSGQERKFWEGLLNGCGY